MLALILLYRHSMHVVAAVWAIMALGDGLASVAGERLRGPALPYNREKTWAGFASFALAGTAGAYTLARWANPALNIDKALLVCAATALVGALVESAPIRLDDNATVPLVSGGFMFCAFLMERSALASNLPYLGRRIVLAVMINLAFALVALRLRLVARSGACAGFLMGVAVYLGYGWKSFSLLLAFFALGSIATRLGYAKKAARGIAERRGGARGWREALANTLAGAFFSILVITTHHEAGGADRDVRRGRWRHRVKRDRPVAFRARLLGHDVRACSSRGKRGNLARRDRGGTDSVGARCRFRLRPGTLYQGRRGAGARGGVCGEPAR